ncbi:carbohydrate-binding protein [Paenibacillus aceris]|uniref:Probable pectate lyase C n=1 Tax=Paenibacillus aceris TaxID=869555 RepID=A0ABS4I375_9BACL|nr:carbohydrate-binding protein [Paenibacillus aceris]MBP1965354.1 hypothetical protein [Paenibacillus aceris]NHW36037.1 carbohydrate-binding protein [Paenibacillus aceris]
MRVHLKQKCLSVMLVSGMLASSFTGFASAETGVQSAIGSDQLQIYVATIGSDASGDGTQAKPFATVAKAKAKVKEIIQALPEQKMTSDIVVNVGQGDYYLNEPLEFNAGDSGTNGYNVVYRSADGIGKANLIGGSKITGWQKSTDDDVAAGLLDSIKDKVYKVKLDPTKFNFNALYVNDNKAIMARTQNKEYDPRFPASAGTYMNADGGGMRDISYRSGDLDQRAIDGMVKAQQAGATEIAQVYTWDGPAWDWFTDTIPIKSIDTSTRKLTFPQDPQKPELYRPKYPIGGGSRYYLQGNIAFMDVPGEYFYNKQTGDLYYYPKTEDGSVDQWTVVAPTMQKILYFKGDEKGTGSYADYKLAPDPLKQTHNIRIDGLTLKDTEYTNYFTSGWNETDAGGGIGKVPPESAGSTLPAYSEQTDRVEYKVGAVTMINTNNITIENTKIRNIGLFGIAMYRDNDHNTIKNCDIGFVGYGGITSDGGYPGVGKYNNFHTITNVAIHDIGQNVGHASGITWMDTGNSNISHLEIYNSPRRAIMNSAGIRRNSLDSNYDELRDMYTVNNRYSYINIHDMQQDGGEDSAIFWVYLLRGEEILKRHGSDPNVKTENGATYYDVGEGKYNYLDQVIVDGVGANPSMHDKNTVHGMDLTMGGSGTHLSNIKVTNPQSKTMRIEETVTKDKFHMDNLNNNYKNDNILNLFDDSKMEYDKIGLTSDFPFERYHKVVSKPNTNDMYFQDDFESGKLDLTKWSVEKGQPNIDQVYMSEGALNGKYSLATNGNKNKSTGVVVSRKFNNDLNKMVEVQYFDKRQDYAGSDAGEGGGSYDITPNAFVRVDNGSDIVALGANGDVSKDYFVYKDGTNVVKTNVKRSYGWHNFKFDYTSLTDVKMYIDGTLVATLPKTSFNYIGMGDWEAKGGEAYFDQLYVYGGSAAPAVQDLEFPIVSLNKPTTASGSSAGNTPEKANDGSNSSKWSADSAAPGSWWQVDLQTKQNISTVDINFNSAMKYTELTSFLQSSYINMPKSITFQVSDDGSNWTTVGSKVTNLPKNDTYGRAEPRAQTYALFTAGRYLRLLFEDGAQGTGIDLNEVSVWTKDHYTMYGIKAPAAITLGAGVAKTAEALGLPNTVKLVTDSADADASVAWNVEASSYDPSKNAQQTFTVTGTVTLPYGFQNPNNVPLTTSVSVTVKGAVEIPATIEAEDYVNMSGIQTENSSEGGKNVGYIDPGDWMDYSIIVPSTGTYKVNYRVSVNSGKTGSVNFLVDGVSQKITSLPSTGGWQNWATVSDTVSLSQGAHTVRLQVVNGGWNFNKFELNLMAQAIPQSTLTGAQQVNAGQTFNLTMGLTGVTESVYQQVYAQDLVLNYDPSKLQFDSVTSLKDGFQVIDTKEAVPGHIRIVVASVSGNQGASAQGELLTFKFTAKSATQATSTTVSVGNVIIANGEGNELQIGGANREMQISVPSTPVDKSLLNASISSAQAKYNAAVEGNEDGQYATGSKAQLQLAIDAAKAVANDSIATQPQVDSAKTVLESAVQVFDSKRISANVNGQDGVTIGDLAIVAAAYGKQSGQAGWNVNADVNKDGKVGIEDLAIVAKAILQ